MLLGKLSGKLFKRRPGVPAGARPAVLAAVLALPFVLLPASASAAADRAGGWNEAGCVPDDRRSRPVVLVHGTLGNAVDNWLGLAPYLAERGWCVYSFDYGKLPGVPFFHGLGPMEESSAELAAHIDEVRAETGAAEVDVVGHSQGGVLPRHYLRHHPGAADAVHTLVGIAPNTNGTTLGGLTALLDHFPAVRDLLTGFTPALTQQVAGSDFMTELNEGGYTVPGVDYTVIATRYDAVVTPWESQFIHESGVDNVLLQELCPRHVSGHLTIALADPLAFRVTANALDPAHAEPVTCGSA